MPTTNNKVTIKMLAEHWGMKDGDVLLTKAHLFRFNEVENHYSGFSIPTRIDSIYPSTSLTPDLLPIALMVNLPISTTKFWRVEVSICNEKELHMVIEDLQPPPLTDAERLERLERKVFGKDE